MNPETLDAALGLSRRRFLASGAGLVVTFSLWPHLAGAAEEAQNKGEKPIQAPPLPGSLKTAPLLDAWIRIDAQGAVTVFTGKAELGQGIKTALIQIAAEELVVDVKRVTLVTADTARTANEGYTAGSHSMQDSGTAIRHAAAQVRALLVGRAAERLGEPAAGLTVENGVVKSPGGKSAPYGELVSDELLHVNATQESPLRDPASHTVMGKPMQRVDIPAKVAGGVAYVQDLRPEGMVHARVVRPPSPAAKLVSVDDGAVAKLPRVLKVVRDGSFLAVIAEREYDAIVAMRALERTAKWEERATLPDARDLYKFVQGLPSKDFVIRDAADAPVAAGTSYEATYHRPYQMHGSIGPSCAIGLMNNDGLTVWTHSQGVYPLRGALAEMLAMPPERIRCIHAEGSGCYGHNAADDVAADAALLARAFPDRPVRVQWMREQEHAWEPYGPPMVTHVKADLDPGGRIVRWSYDVWSNTHSTRPGKAGNLLAATHLENAFTPPPPVPLPQPEGGGDRNAILLYSIPNERTVHHFLPEMPIRVSALRALGAYMNVFTIESFMDELAIAAKTDPVEFRLRHMRDPRAQDVIRLAAEKFGWSSYQRRPGRGRGFAFARYKNLAAYAAIACEVEVRRETGAVRLVRAVAAVDSGEAVNPDGIRNQIEGGILQSSSWTINESVAFDRTRILSRDWGGYPILRFTSVPETIDVHVIDRPGQPFLGTGEATQGPTSAAVANAVADATGARFRELPINAERVRRSARA